LFHPNHPRAMPQNIPAKTINKNFMKTSSIIYWFSGTGNSRSIAEDLANSLGDTKLASIPLAIKNNLEPAERIGLVFPVYAFGLPLIVRRFLKRSSFAGAGYIYTVATMGGLAGSVHREARDLLKRQGADLAAGWSLAMPGNYPALSNPPPPEKQAGLFEKAKQRIAAIATKILRGATEIYEDTRLPLAWPLAFVRHMGIDKFPDSDEKFNVGQSCKHCGVCAKVCPVENIRIVEGKPVWLHHCEQCMACLQWCPAQAIEFGSATVGKKRYHHPRYKASDFCLREE